jgi:cytochrome c-type biogenesis protein CcmF
MTVAHLGIAVFITGVTLVKGYETERDVRMAVGDTVTVGGYTFRFAGVRDAAGPNYRAVRGAVDVSRDGRPVRTLRPEKRIYNAQEMPMTEAAIASGVLGDLYVSLGDPVGDGAWTLRVYHKPFVTWIWGGCLLMALGGLLALSDRRYRVRAAREDTVAGAATA